MKKDLKNKKIKASLRINDIPIQQIETININTSNMTKSKQVVWDANSLEEQEAERQLNPRKKINEPKTPYECDFEKNENEDDYISRIYEINRTQPTVNKYI